MALAGVGSVDSGQWEDWTGRAFHIRRRLSEAEQRLVSGGGYSWHFGSCRSRLAIETSFAGCFALCPACWLG